MLKQVYIPLVNYEQEYRYSYYLSFLIRIIYKDVSYTKIDKKEFIDNWFKQGFWTRRHLKNVWEKWAYTNKFLNVWKRTRNILSLKGKRNFELVLVPATTYTKIKTITDFRYFVTSCIAWNNTIDNKWRWYNNIAKGIWTNYKQTACNIVKKAESKFWLEKKNRYCNFNWYLTRLTNTYDFWWVTYIYNKFYNSINIRATRSKKALSSHQELIWKRLIRKGEKLNLKYMPGNLYIDFNLLAY